MSSSSAKQDPVLRRSKRRRVAKDAAWFVIDTIRAHNPDLDEEQAHRAYLCTNNRLHYTVQDWDNLVNYICGDNDAPLRMRFERKSYVPLQPTELQLYTTSFDTGTINNAVYAGFFLFGSEFVFPGKPLEDRSFLNMELTMGEGKENGRVMLEGGKNVKLGKKFLHGLRDQLKHPDTHPPAARPQNRYHMSVNTCFDKVCDRIIEQHGIDWVGFSRILTAFSRMARREHLHGHTQRQRRGFSHGARASGFEDTAVDETVAELVRFVSVELWDTTIAGDSDGLVSGEIGYIVGSCYTCLSLFTQPGQTASWLSRLRTRGAILWLERAGVQLFDVGCTADYYCHLHGFTKYSSEDFVRLWRSHRSTALHRYNIRFPVHVHVLCCTCVMHAC